jgi:hypothetical protein
MTDISGVSSLSLYSISHTNQQVKNSALATPNQTNTIPTTPGINDKDGDTDGSLGTQINTFA